MLGTEALRCRAALPRPSFVMTIWSHFVNCFYGANAADAPTTILSFETIPCNLRVDNSNVETMWDEHRVHLVTPYQQANQQQINKQQETFEQHTTKEKTIEKSKEDRECFCRLDKFRRIFNRLDKCF